MDTFADFISLMLLAALFAVCLFCWHKEKERKEHESWIHDCRKCLAHISHRFLVDCQNLAEKAFTIYTHRIQNNRHLYGPDSMKYFFLSDYQKSIDKLKEDYVANVTEKAKDCMPHYHFTSIPDNLLEEYISQIDRIHRTFADFHYLMWKQIQELKDE